MNQTALFPAGFKAAHSLSGPAVAAQLHTQASEPLRLLGSKRPEPEGGFLFDFRPYVPKIRYQLSRQHLSSSVATSLQAPVSLTAQARPSPPMEFQLPPLSALSSAFGADNTLQKQGGRDHQLMSGPLYGENPAAAADKQGKREHNSPMIATPSVPQDQPQNRFTRLLLVDPVPELGSKKPNFNKIGKTTPQKMQSKSRSELKISLGPANLLDSSASAQSGGDEPREQEYIQKFYKQGKKLAKGAAALNRSDSLAGKKIDHFSDCESEQSSLDIEDEIKIEKLGRDCQTRTSLKYLREVAPRFSRNIVIQTQQKRQTKYVRKQQPQKPSTFKYRYHNIYKNYLRDIKVFFKDQFDAYKVDLKARLLRQANVNLNYQLAEASFFVMLIDFTLRKFDIQFLQHLANHQQCQISSAVGLARKVRELAFKLGCYILPKQIIQRFAPPKERNLKLQEKVDQILDFVINTSNNPEVLRLILSLRVDEPSNPEHKRDWQVVFTQDFFGLLKDQSKAVRKLRVTEVYRLFFRFSVEKLFFFVDELDLMIILIQYMQSTAMRRVHFMISLRLNAPCYYRATENLIRESKFNQALAGGLANIPAFAPLRLGFSTDNEKAEVSLASLEQMNTSLH